MRNEVNEELWMISPDARRSTVDAAVVGIFVTDAEARPMRSLDVARALVGEGLEGDRYALGKGHFSPRARTDGGRELTLIESEVLDDLETQHGTGLEPAEVRRNIVSRGVRLNELVGSEFYLGDVRCLGVGLCPPCLHLEELTGKSLLKPLLGRGGLRAAIVSGGDINVGDTIKI